MMVLATLPRTRPGPIGSDCSATAAAQCDAHKELYAEVAKQAAISGRDAESICSLSREQIVLADSLLLLRSLPEAAIAAIESIVAIDRELSPGALHYLSGVRAESWQLRDPLTPLVCAVYQSLC